MRWREVMSRSKAVEIKKNKRQIIRENGNTGTKIRQHEGEKKL